MKILNFLGSIVSFLGAVIAIPAGLVYIFHNQNKLFAVAFKPNSHDIDIDGIGKLILKEVENHAYTMLLCGAIIWTVFILAILHFT